MARKKPVLKLDIKKRVTLGKYIGKDVTGFCVEKFSDGTLILSPMSYLVSDEQAIYNNKKHLKSLQKSLLEVRKLVLTHITFDFWENEICAEYIYTNEFLKVFESLISKKPEFFDIIKTSLINLSKSSFVELENQKTRQGDTIFLTPVDENLKILWTK